MKQLTQVAEISVSYNPEIKKKPSIHHSKDAYLILKEFFDENTVSLQEQFIVMFLNKSNRVLGVYPLSTGGITSCLVDVRLLLSVALKTASTGIVLAHNHPSGSLKPSRQDQELTGKIKEAAKYLDITIMDHIILTPEDGMYYSFADEGIL